MRVRTERDARSCGDVSGCLNRSLDARRHVEAFNDAAALLLDFWHRTEPLVAFTVLSITGVIDEKCREFTTARRIFLSFVNTFSLRYWDVCKSSAASGPICV